MFKNALVSCSDKTNLAGFLKPLQAKGMRIVSTGGTAQYLRSEGLTVFDVADQTGFPEVMDGRVKTLHPKIHMALLARIEESEDLETLKNYSLEPFDLVVGNLYPFEKEPSVDTIDIGGPSFLRAAAKSFSRIAVVCDPNDYDDILRRGTIDENYRQRLAAKIFAHTSSYDAMIAKFYGVENLFDFPDHALGGKFVSKLRYGENPQQTAIWYRTTGEDEGLHKAQILQGKELSYNNILDLDAAVSTLQDFSGATCVGVKHNNPCGVARGKNITEAVEGMLSGDPQSIFGGIVAMNCNVNREVAEKLNQLFLECIVAPGFDADALAIFSKKKNLRILSWPGIVKSKKSYSYKSVYGGFLVQEADQVDQKWNSNWTVVGPEIPVEIKEELLFSWQVCAHLKSNAIAITANGQTVGLGMGQVNRVDSVQQAIERMQRFHPNCKTPVLASDAFFPFPDSIEKIAQAGIKFIIQPGGSIKDDEVKEASRNLGITMVLTGERHFLH